MSFSLSAYKTTDEISNKLGMIKAKKGALLFIKK